MHFTYIFTRLRNLRFCRFHFRIIKSIIWNPFQRSIRTMKIATMAFIIPMEAIQQPQKVLLILHPLSSLIRKKNRINFLTFYLYIFNFPDMMRPLQPELLIGGNHQSLCCFHHLNHTNHVNMATSSSDELHEVNSSMRRRRRNPRPESVSSSHCNGPGKLWSLLDNAPNYLVGCIILKKTWF